METRLKALTWILLYTGLNDGLINLVFNPVRFFTGIDHQYLPEMDLNTQFSLDVSL